MAARLRLEDAAIAVALVGAQHGRQVGRRDLVELDHRRRRHEDRVPPARRGRKPANWGRRGVAPPTWRAAVGRLGAVPPLGAAVRQFGAVVGFGGGLVAGLARVEAANVVRVPHHDHTNKLFHDANLSGSPLYCNKRRKP
jgi:hypothetical protein